MWGYHGFHRFWVIVVDCLPCEMMASIKTGLAHTTHLLKRADTDPRDFSGLLVFSHVIQVSIIDDGYIYR